MFQIGHSIRASLEHFDLVIETFYEAAGFPINKVIQDFLPPAGKGVDELVEAA